SVLAIKADAGVYALVEMVGAVAIAALLWASARRIGHGTLTIGVLVAFIAYVERFFAPIRDLSTKYTIMQSAMAAAERIFGLLDTDELDAPPGALAPQDEPALAAENASETPAIDLDHVQFSYRPDDPVLEDVSFRVKKGQAVAMVGSTGAGKTTLIRVLARLYEISGGAIRLSGKDVRSLSPSDLRRRLVTIPQDVFLFTGTVLDNLSIGMEGD